MYAEDADAAFAALGSDGEMDDGGSDNDSDFNMSEAEEQESENTDFRMLPALMTQTMRIKTADVVSARRGSRVLHRKRKKPKKMPKKDPDAPKKPLSSFMLFGNEMRAKIKEENPDIPFSGVGKILGERWRALDSESKAKYNEAALAAKAEYEKVYAEYLQSDRRKQWEGKMMAEYGMIPGVKKNEG